MFRSLEYHIGMRPVTSPAVATLAVLAVSVLVLPLLVPAAEAQINGAPASVTSPGFGGRPFNGTPPSVTSLGPNSFAPGPQFPLAPAANGFRHGDGHNHNRPNRRAVTPYLYAYPVPYAVPVPYGGDDNSAADDNNTDADNDPEYQGGPTVFDRRGSGADSYVPPVRNAPPPHAADPDDPPADPGPPPQPTVLIFRDGHKLEVGNYAIVGVTLFDLTPGHPRRIALADLDLAATRKLNEDQGVTFQLPPSLQAN